MDIRHAPHDPTTTLIRPRLLARLDEAWAYRLTLIIAPAGYGKTTLLRQWTGRRDDARIAWCALDEDEADLPTFLTRLVAALAPFLPDGEPHARPPLHPPRGDPSTAFFWLLNHLESPSRPLLLILDDLHSVAAGQEVQMALERLLRHAPPSLHIILSARQEPPLADIPRLRAAGQVLELTAADLRFTNDEVVHLVEASLNLTLDEHLAAQLTARTEGWAVALRLACQTGAHYGPDEAERLLREFGGTTRQLYDYLARVVLAGQSAETRAFLRRTAILNRLTPALCDAVLGRDDSAAILSSLEAAGLFLFAEDTARTTYRYHALFREFLQRRLLETEGREAVRRLHRRAAARHLEQGNDEQAIVHLLAAEDFEAAADLIRPLRGRLFITSRHHLLENWLSLFPPRISEAHPWLLLTRARLAVLRRDLPQARAACRQALPHLLAADDRQGLYTVHHELAGLAMDSGDFAQAETLYRQALAYAEDDTQRAIALGQIAICRYMRGDSPEDAPGLLEQAVGLAERGGHPLGRAGLISLRARLLAWMGDFRRALADWSLALDLMETYGNRHQQSDICSRAARLHCLLGEFKRAETLLRRALDLSAAFGQPASRAQALDIRGLLHRARSDPAAARRDHEEALAIRQRLGDEYGMAATLGHLSTLARHEGHLEDALRHAEAGLRLRERLGNAYEIALARTDLGAVHLARSDPAEAERAWRPALETFTRYRARYEQARLHFYLAALAHRRGEADAARAHLDAALDLAHRHGYGFLFAQEPAWAAPLLVPRAVAGDAFAADLLPSLGRPALAPLVRRLDAPTPAIRAQAAALLGRLGHVEALRPLSAHRQDSDPAVRQAVAESLSALTALPLPPLRVHTLGRFRLWCGDREITHWPRRSARDAFLLLLLRHPQPLAADALAEALWPNSPPDKASQNVRRAVSDLRRVLQPELPPGYPSGYLLAEDETYALVLPPGSHLDDRAFEEAIRRELTGDIPPTPEEQEAAIHRLEAALALYTGDYLPELPYVDWALTRREHLRRLLVAGARRLARLQLTVHRPEEAATAARRALEREPWDDEATLLLMRAYAALGDIPAAVRAYESHRERLRRDLDLPPRDDLTALYDQLRRQRLAPRDPGPHQPPTHS